jgi:hypothetical protein
MGWGITIKTDYKDIDTTLEGWESQSKLITKTLILLYGVGNHNQN